MQRERRKSGHRGNHCKYLLRLERGSVARIETNTGQIDFKCDFFFKPHDPRLLDRFIYNEIIPTEYFPLRFQTENIKKPEF